MEEHPIQGLMQTAMENIKGMVDVNTIVGDPVQTPDGTVILPISKVGFGFAAGGSDYYIDDKVIAKESSGQDKTRKTALPFGGGSGGGVSIRPIAFLVVSKDGVHIVPLDSHTHLLEKIIDTAPYMLDKIQSFLSGSSSNSNSNSSSSTSSSTSTANGSFASESEH